MKYVRSAQSCTSKRFYAESQIQLTQSLLNKIHALEQYFSQDSGFVQVHTYSFKAIAKFCTTALFYKTTSSSFSQSVLARRIPLWNGSKVSVNILINQPATCMCTSISHTNTSTVSLHLLYYFTYLVFSKLACRLQPGTESLINLSI